ncbi:hypothetical protein [Amycolatopsis coloradensis]|uniref:hypothetical protein n=1 Tax=Amycolatopsis coloradensis TaxID=76021 RepID=UPI0011781111|nr:hypothetical protein [Amycolatopsis coloradensis]
MTTTLSRLASSSCRWSGTSSAVAVWRTGPAASVAVLTADFTVSSRCSDEMSTSALSAFRISEDAESRFTIAVAGTTSTAGAVNPGKSSGIKESALAETSPTIQATAVAATTPPAKTSGRARRRPTRIASIVRLPTSGSLSGRLVQAVRIIIVSFDGHVAPLAKKSADDGIFSLPRPPSRS